MNNNDYKRYFLDWYSNFLTVDYFAEYYGMSEQTARHIIYKGRLLYNSAIS
jgi:hypothetical protein